MTKLSLCELLSAYLFCTVKLWLIHLLSDEDYSESQCPTNWILFYQFFAKKTCKYQLDRYQIWIEYLYLPTILSWIKRMHFLELYTEKHWTLLDVIFGTKNFLIFRFWKWCNLKVQDTIFWVWGSDFGHEDDWRWLNWQGIFPVQLLSLSHFTIPTVSKNMTQKNITMPFLKNFWTMWKFLHHRVSFIWITYYKFCSQVESLTNYSLHCTQHRQQQE